MTTHLEKLLKEFEDIHSKIFYTRPQSGKECSENKQKVRDFLTTHHNLYKERLIRKLKGLAVREYSDKEEKFVGDWYVNLDQVINLITIDQNNEKSRTSNLR